MTKIDVLGGGITGLWQAFLLTSSGFKVRLIEKSAHPFEDAASNIAGAMLAPYCECEPSDKLLLSLGTKSLALWRASPFEISNKGTLVFTNARDAQELDAFANRTSSHRLIERKELSELEPDIAPRYARALYYEDEAHLAPRQTLNEMLSCLKAKNVELCFGIDSKELDNAETDYVIDCRGMGAKAELDGLRPVRGEMVVVRCSDIEISRPVRLLHPRMPCYIVPWPDHHYMIGATVIESEDQGPITVRSVLELLGSAFAVHPGFGEAQIIEFSAGQRPAFANNLPKIEVFGKTISVNGLYRNGFLLAPLLADLVVTYIHTGEKNTELFQ